MGKMVEKRKDKMAGVMRIMDLARLAAQGDGENPIEDPSFVL